MNIVQALALTRQKLSWLITGQDDTEGNVFAVLQATDPAKLEPIVDANSIKADRYDYIIKHFGDNLAYMLSCEKPDLGNEIDERIELDITPSQRKPD